MAGEISSRFLLKNDSVQTSNFGKPDAEQSKVLQNISKAHVESFNLMLRESLSKAVLNIRPLEMESPAGERIKIEIMDCRIKMPIIHKDNYHARSLKVYPSECRLRKLTYSGPLCLTVSWSKNGKPQETYDKIVGEAPIMVKSEICSLNGLKPAELIQRGEEAEEFGGYFIVNGNERVVRMLVMQRRNYPLAMSRPRWKHRGDLFTEYGVSIRCVRGDQTSTNMVLHYLSDGSAKLMFTYKRELFFVPIMMVLKALYDAVDREIYLELVRGKEDDSFYKGCIANMLRQLQDEGLYTSVQIKNYLGSMFRVKLGLPEWYSNTEVADYLLKDCICIHLDSNVDKFHMLVFMTRKLFAVAKKECTLENPDSPMFQEVMLTGQLYTLIIKEKLESWLFSVRTIIDRIFQKNGKTSKISESIISNAFTHGLNLSRPIEYVLATGNFVSRSGGTLQNAGLTIVADKLNYLRYVSHFRAIHRGAFFQEMRTTTVRRLLPEAWGFLCPVQTPDGAPCGLLNHIAAECEVVNYQFGVSGIPPLLVCLGAVPVGAPLPSSGRSYYVVHLDGRILGYVMDDDAQELVNSLRALKVRGLRNVPNNLEIVFVKRSNHPSQYPGIFLFSTPSRLIRPVINIKESRTENNELAIEYIGTMEQVYLTVCTSVQDYKENITTHQEKNGHSTLSIIASMVPYMNFNPSPRNIYQCQMSKQAMGTPCHAFRYRSDNKLYRLLTPHAPLVRSSQHSVYKMDDYPFGTNAVVAIISNGYNMEDAIVINKAAIERGILHGGTYKREYVNLRAVDGIRGSHITYTFGRKGDDAKLTNFIDADGLPYIGVKLNQDDPLCSYVHVDTGEAKVQKYKSSEPAYVVDVLLLGNDSGTDILQNICVVLYVSRTPIIGDKFASRHGQKGVCSLLRPAEDMPFTRDGLIPDILFNPHSFVSRMTVGQLIESLAGKASALLGKIHESTPYKFAESCDAQEYYGQVLQEAGYNYYGTEELYCGRSGREYICRIYVGIVCYQRLRHMVSDKYQVRSTGPIDSLTHQPIKGRKRGGGIRVGEMERDSLVAHGSSLLLRDRLFNCSDKCVAYVCTKCECIISPIYEKPPPENSLTRDFVLCQWICNVCESPDHIDVIYIPYVFRYLAAELASSNIKVNISIK